jgi:hypothetical protein
MSNTPKPLPTSLAKWPKQELLGFIQFLQSDLDDQHDEIKALETKAKKLERELDSALLRETLNTSAILRSRAADQQKQALRLLARLQAKTLASVPLVDQDQHPELQN